MNLENSELFAKIFLDIIHGYTENVFGICTHCNLFANFSLTSFTDTLKMYLAYALTVTYLPIFPCHTSYWFTKISPAKILLCTVLVLVLKYF